MAETSPSCIAVDWGTTSLRLWMLDANGTPLGESRGAEGMMVARERGFEAVLHEHLARLSAPKGLPILVCGMAGARQGWVEAPYLPVPAALSSLAEHSVAVPSALGPVRILPGVAQFDAAAPDVMRGEETQLLGVTTISGTGDALVCMPGTHSKWVELESGTVRRLSTYMTGELFDLLRHRSILRHGIEADSSDDPAAFRQAVREALSEPDALSARLFALRAGPLLSLADPASGGARLSGLLIGAELRAVREHLTQKRSEVLLVSAGHLGSLYEYALREAGFDVRIVDAEQATKTALFQLARRLWPVSRSS